MGSALAATCVEHPAEELLTHEVVDSPLASGQPRLSQSSSGAVGSSASVVPAEGASPPVYTGDELSASARHLAYQQRKERIQARRMRNGSIGSANREDFLSSLHEVEADVRYRFTFVVLGAAGERAAENACCSWAAQALQDSSPHKDFSAESPSASPMGRSRLPSLDEASTSWRTSQSSSSIPVRVTKVSFRCLSKVALPAKCQETGDQPQLAKLAFKPLRFCEDVPLCGSRAEALSTVVVLFLTIDGEFPGEGTFEDQLQSLAAAVDRMRARGKASLRPVRAVILCYSRTEYRSEHGERWAASLADFEHSHGELWKFGPVSLQDGDVLHTTFAEIASLRIAKSLLEGADAPAGPKEPEEVEQDGEDVPELAFMQEPFFSRTSHRHDSETSEGFQRPPVFEAEFDGSECGEAALELHQRLFGIRGSGSTPTNSTTSTDFFKGAKMPS